MNLLTCRFVQPYLERWAVVLRVCHCGLQLVKVRHLDYHLMGVTREAPGQTWPGQIIDEMVGQGDAGSPAVSQPVRDFRGREVGARGVGGGCAVPGSPGSGPSYLQTSPIYRLRAARAACKLSMQGLIRPLILVPEMRCERL